ncbi:TIGR02391 family protein [Amycolatopsis sp. NPDC059657]|uniref:TIGR02391 family protein n=1 Tax=Amycolatopsis sp. NPDC059657 TaxID=3346899 RepID=UPI00366FC8FF
MWQAAKDLWRSGHYRSAISSVALRVNAETQAKVGRMDVSEVKLFQPTFSSDSPKPGNPQLRVWRDDGSDTYKSIHRGISAFAEGLYAAIRNPNNHAVQAELDETVALEQLAAFSVLARWVDDATVEH